MCTVSARSDAALSTLAAKYVEGLALAPEASLSDVCYTANTGRASLPCRAAIVVGSREDLASQLRTLAAGGEAPAVIRGRLESVDRPRVGFLFTGQGSQYVSMGRGLFDSEPVFRDALVRCDRLVSGDLERPLLSVLYPEDGAPTPIDQTAFTQPALFSVEYALSELWRILGRAPGRT